MYFTKLHTMTFNFNRNYGFKINERVMNISQILTIKLLYENKWKWVNFDNFNIIVWNFNFEMLLKQSHKTWVNVFSSLFCCIPNSVFTCSTKKTETFKLLTFIASIRLIDGNHNFKSLHGNKDVTRLFFPPCMHFKRNWSVKSLTDRICSLFTW